MSSEINPEYLMSTSTFRHNTPVNCIAIIHHRVNYLTIGSIITITKKYVDKVYVILDNYDERIYGITNPLGAEVINAGKTNYATVLNRIKAENDAPVIITLYGDGTHDPGKISELLKNIEEGYDIVIGSSNIDYNSRANEIIMFLNNKKPKNYQKGFIACTYNYFDGLNFDALKIDHGKDFTEAVITHSKNNGKKIKNLYFDEKNFGIFNMYKIGIVVPSYNEELLIGETIRGIPNYVDKIFIIDDCSKDKTPKIIEEMTDPRIVNIRHEVNKGVGAAIVTGYKRALEDEMDIVAIMAGDNQMDPDQLPRLLIPIIEGKADYTKGNRLISKDFRKGMSKWRSFGNFILTMLTKIASGYWGVTDPQNGYTAISRQALEALDLDAIYTYYGYCNDMLVKLNTYGMRTIDIPMPSRYGREKSKIKYSRYIRKVSPMLFRGFLWRLKTKYILLDFNPLVLFYAASMLMVPFGIIFSAYIVIEKILHQPVSQNFPLLAAFITLMGLQFLMFAMLFDMQADKSKTQL
ncbi:MAG: glycosyltransferase [Dehalobacter sp.]|nr:glycosyltransferase [Dehalobacter sp.]